MKLETARKHDLKINPSHLTLGLKYGIKMCCILYFQYPHTVMRYVVPEYYEKITELTNNKGVILCPDCLIKKLMSIKKEKKCVMDTEIKKLERRITKLEKEMGPLKSRLEKLENETKNTDKRIKNISKKLKSKR